MFLNLHVALHASFGITLKGKYQFCVSCQPKYDALIVILFELEFPLITFICFVIHGEHMLLLRHKSIS